MDQKIINILDAFGITHISQFDETGQLFALSKVHLLEKLLIFTYNFRKLF
jgi:hypothetical protein